MFGIRHTSVRLLQRPPKRARSRGQGLVEFALLAPVLLLILLFAIDFGRALYGWVVLQNSARIAANYAALNPDGWRDNDAGVKAGYQVQIHDDLQAVGYCVPAGYVAPDPVFTDGPDTADAAGPNDSVYDVGDSVTVALTCDFAPLTPIITFITGATVELGASSEFRIRAGDVAGLPHSTRIPPPPTPAPSGSGSPSSPPSAPPSAPPSVPPSCTVSAGFTRVPTSGSVQSGTSVTFMNASTATGCAIVSYQWTFPNGAPATASSAGPHSVVFSVGSNTQVTVSLTVTTDSGASDTHTDQFQVRR
jgi:Flp pilus assembly protein TadG